MFNSSSRFRNVILSSSCGVFEQMIFYILSFVYRTIFLTVLSKEYLGISGLFTNILQVFSLTEMGIGSVIAYRLYKPIKEKRINECHALIVFYKNVYRFIALSVLVLGFLFYPFLNSIIADTNEIPQDVNLRFIYWLYVLQSVASYLFVYAQSLLAADQKNYLISLANAVSNAVSTILKIFILIYFKSFTASLLSGILFNIGYNCVFAIVIKKKYKDIYEETQTLTKEEKKNIFLDTGSLMCHKIGYVVLNSTDSIILSKYIGIAVLGVYSNYSMISTAIDAILNKLLGSFVSSIGNLSLERNIHKTHDVYNKLLFINFWLVALCTICFCSLVNPFITIWVGNSYLLDMSTVIVISCNMFFNSSGIINTVFINANGLFVKDRIRPLIQAIVNLAVSICLVKMIGLAGVFIGTLISNAITAWWRQPNIVFKYIFQCKSIVFFKEFFQWFFLTIVMCCFYYYIFGMISDSLGAVLFKFLFTFVFTNVIFIMLFRKKNSYIYCKNLFLSKLHDVK